MCRTYVAILAVPWLLTWSLMLVADPLTIPPGQFETIRALIKPHAGEDQWTEIPWLTNLSEARKKAAAEGKPILLWEMDGHPLGCT
jgi:hypothetical protein